MSIPTVDLPALEEQFVVRVRKNPGHTWLALALVAAVLLTVLSAWRQGWFTPTSNVYIDLPSASGMQVGTPVKLKGFKIGEVDDVVLGESLVVRVRLKLVTEKMALLGPDASARFGRDGPIGGKFIELVPGTRRNGRLAAEQTLRMDAGNDIDDVMATVKDAVEKLAQAISKIDPILDDAHKLTGEAVAMRESVRSSLSTTMANVQAMSAQFRQASESARTVAGHIDEDRAKLVGDLRGVIKQSDAAVESAKNSLQKVEAELPATLGRANALLDNARDASADAKQMVREVRGDVPALVRSGRTAAQDAADITSGLKGTWPLSGMVKPPAPNQLPLDSFEGTAP